MAIAAGTQIRVGIAGLGRFGKLHARILSRFPDVRLMAACDPVEAELAAVKTVFGIEHTFTDYEQMLEGANLDCVFLVSPEPLHAGQARAAFAKGLPVFTEKPLATAPAEGAELLRLAQANNLHLQVGFVLRFEAQHAFLRERLNSGVFGDLVTLRLKRNCSKAWFADYGDRAHSVHETMIHDIDLSVWLTGSRCERVYAVSRYISGRKFPDSTLAVLQFASGAVATVESSWLIPSRAPANVLTETWYGTIDAELEAIGTRQSARLRLLESPLQIWTDEVTKHPEAGLWPDVYGNVAGALREEDAHFLACVRAGTSSPIASIPDAIHGLEIAEAIIASAASGTEVQIPARPQPD